MSAKTKILIAEHDVYDIELLYHELNAGGISYISEVVDNEPDYRKSIRNFTPDIILSDYTFPSFSGLMAFKIRQKLAPDTPFIFVSGTIGEEKSIELIKNGVTDYALKDKLFALIPKMIRALKESKERKQKKKAEEALQLSENLLARAQEIAHMGSWELDFSTNTVRWSNETSSIFGLQHRQKRLSLKTWLSFIHSEDVDLVLRKLNESRDFAIDFSINYRIINKKGATRHIYSECKIDFDSTGKPAGLYGIAHDVTKVVLLENKLVEERHKKQIEITAAVLTAQEAERNEIGKELHDNLNQILGATKMYVEMAKKDEVNRQVLLDKSSVYIVTVIDEIRKISKTLSSPGAQVGLFSSIHFLLDDVFMIHPIKIDFFASDAIEEEYLNKKLQLTIYRIVQEQVNNILKHSKATEATIRLDRIDDEVILLISDNGVGCDISNEAEGVGIKNIKSRTNLYSGTVDIASKPGNGYELKVALSMNSYMNKPVLLEAMQVF